MAQIFRIIRILFETFKKSMAVAVLPFIIEIPSCFNIPIIFHARKSIVVSRNCCFQASGKLRDM